MHGQAQHLHQVAHRAFAAIGLPVGIGNETDRRVQRKIGRDPREMLGIQGQHTLQPLQHVQDNSAHQIKQQHGNAIARPGLFGLRIDSAKLVKRAFESGRFVAGKDARHEGADRLYQQHDNDAEKHDL